MQRSELELKRQILREKLLAITQDKEKLLAEFIGLTEKREKPDVVDSDISPERNLLLLKRHQEEEKIFERLMEPEPVPLPDDQKDSAAYETLRKKLVDNKPLYDLTEHIHKLSRFMRIGKDIGAIEEIKSEQKVVEITSATFNLGCLTEANIGKKHLQINGKELRSDKERSADAVEYIKQFGQHIKSLDLFFLQEAFDGHTRKFLKEEFAKLGYGFTGDEGEKCLNEGSGLFAFYKKDRFIPKRIRFVPYPRGRVDSPEFFANKGVLVVEWVDKKANCVFTSISSHEQTAGGLFPKLDDETYGTISEVRALDSQIMHSLSRQWIDSPITDEQGNILPHIGIIYGVDMNKNLARPQQCLSISTGTSFNLNSDVKEMGFVQGDIKFSGDTNLEKGFYQLPKRNWPIPVNELSLQVDKKERKSGGKEIDPDRKAKADKENLSVGSSFGVEVLTENKIHHAPLNLQDAQNHAIDLSAAEPDQSELVNFECYRVLATNPKGLAITDHEFTFSVSRFEPQPELKSKKEQLPKKTMVDKNKTTPIVQSTSYLSSWYKFFFGSNTTTVVETPNLKPKI